MVSESSWFSWMSEFAKKLYMKKVFCQKPSNVSFTKNSITMNSTNSTQAALLLMPSAGKSTANLHSVLSVSGRMWNNRCD